MTTSNRIRHALRTVASALFAVAVLADPLVALAQETGTAETWKTARNTVQGDTLVVAAYMAMWFIIGVYVLSLASKQKVQDREIRELEKQLDDHSAK
ncbi:MAG: CcmD family protein [Deltaproteobacteria bacterium]|nr:CcmD family protein [Deltaproteobacteria bacterium]